MFGLDLVYVGPAARRGAQQAGKEKREEAFIKTLNIRLEQETMQFNPNKKKLTPWILTKELKKTFSNRNCAIM